ncbi:MAG TPA: hypothetical protein VFZ63_05675 [Jiangellaceae bacterium]
MTTGHLEASQLAEHAEGLLGVDEAAYVEAHLQQCEICRATAADLASVSAMLAAAPRTLPTPAHVVDRLDRALAVAAAPEPEPARVVQLSWFRRKAPQLLAAAATVGILGFAGWVATTGAGGDDSEDAAEGAAIAEPEEQYDAGAEAGADSERAAEESAAAPLHAEDGELSAAPPELADEIRIVVAQEQDGDDDAADTCGLPLAEERGLELVGAAATDVTGEPAVLVVLRSSADPAVVYGWVVPECDATGDEALVTDQRVELD